MNPNSSLTSYLDASDFLLRRDVRSAYQNCTDDDNDPLLSGSNRNTSPNLMRAILLDPTTPQGSILAIKLSAASGMLESAVLRSSRYAVGDLQALLALGGNSAEYLKEIVASLVMYNLITRRPGPTPPDTVINAYTEAIKALNDLSNGDRIFAFQETASAGLPQTNQFSPVDYSQNNLISVRWAPMMGTRQIARRYITPLGGCGGWLG